MSQQSTKIPRVCEHCGTSFFLRRAGDATRFCSLDCCHLWERNRPMAVRFWLKVNKDGPIPPHRPELGPCWLWTASGSRGYGTLARDYTRKMIKAHQASWEIHFGPIPTGLFVCHACDVRLCVRPSHLWLGTHADNMADMAAKGRAATGERSGRRLWSKLTSETAKAVRAEAAAKLPYGEIAARYGISKATVCNVFKNKVWRE